MAKISAVERDKKRRKMAERFAPKRKALKAIIKDKDVPLEDRFVAQLRLAELPRNASPTRIRNRCEVSGRPRGYYRKFRMSRIALRELASQGQVPGVVKSSW
ncbi:MAG: 30S ribosomal protein S14 [Alphaproteobacteria bacterium]